MCPSSTRVRCQPSQPIGFDPGAGAAASCSASSPSTALCTCSDTRPNTSIRISLVSTVVPLRFVPLGPGSMVAHPALLATGNFLHRPLVAVGIDEVDEAPPRVLHDLGHLDASTGQLGPGGVDVLHAQLHALHRTGGSLGDALAEHDRAARTGRGQL